MNMIVNLILTVMLTLGGGYLVSQFFFNIKKEVIKKVDKGLSKSEPFAQKLTGKKLSF